MGGIPHPPVSPRNNSTLTDVVLSMTTTLNHTTRCSCSDDRLCSAHLDEEDPVTASAPSPRGHVFEDGVRASLADDLAGVLAKVKYLGRYDDLEVAVPLGRLASALGVTMDGSLEVVEIGTTGWTVRDLPPLRGPGEGL